jgi:glycosyltransferase involved in cell wall biosynthesis
MIRIVYGCPISDSPSGGVKVIYKHAELMNNIHGESFVWHPGDKDFRCSWFENNAKILGDNEINPLTDFIILPEIWATGYLTKLKKMGFKVGIYVQNSYMTHININPSNKNEIIDAYSSADLILSISQDSSKYINKILKVPKEKILIQRYSIDHDLFKPSDKKKIISFMPRKMKDHSARVISALSQNIGNDWKIHAIDNLKEIEVAEALSHSIIFLAFSEFEGLPVPPVEAAMCGNIVIGYHGQGGLEYWNEPVFKNIDQGNIQGFVDKVLDVLN